MNKTILTITGSDGTGGSGVQADIRFISSLGGVAASAVTSITVQNTLGIQEFYDLPVDVVRHFNHYADVSFYAEQVNVSPRYLGQVTRRIANRSPKTIIDERIMSEIASLLTTTNKPLKEIAQLLGFSSQSHLSRFFRQHKGMSPSDFKQTK